MEVKFANYNIISGGSPLKSLSRHLPAVYMPDCAHHLDLRAPNKEDPKSVIQGNIKLIKYIGRKREIQFIRNILVLHEKQA
jgi:hypothetical protein